MYNDIVCDDAELPEYGKVFDEREKLYMGKNDRAWRVDHGPWLPICIDSAREIPVVLVLCDAEGREVEWAEKIVKALQGENEVLERNEVD